MEEMELVPRQGEGDEKQSRRETGPVITELPSKNALWATFTL